MLRIERTGPTVEPVRMHSTGSGPNLHCRDDVSCEHEAYAARGSRHGDRKTMLTYKRSRTRMTPTGSLLSHHRNDLTGFTVGTEEISGRPAKFQVVGDRSVVLSGKTHSP